MKKYITLFLSVCLLPGAALAAYDKPYVGEMKEYDARYEDTFVYLARDYNLGFIEMRSANPGVDPWLPGEGTNIVLPMRNILPDAPRDGLVINIPELRMYLYQGDEPPKTFPLGIGRDGLETPMGETKVVRKMEGPTWRPNERMRREDPDLPEVVPPGYDNPMGSHALYLGWPQYAIHGTNRPFGIGRRVSSGCIRMYPEDISAIYEMVPVNTKVTVVNQPVKAAWIDGKLYVEAHPTQTQAEEVEEVGYVSLEDINAQDVERIVSTAGADYEKIDWRGVYKILAERRGYPIAVSGYVSGRDDARKMGPLQEASKESGKEDGESFDLAAASKEVLAVLEGFQRKVHPEESAPQGQVTEASATIQAAPRQVNRTLNP